jgi:hypothetical protein
MVWSGTALLKNVLHKSEAASCYNCIAESAAADSAAVDVMNSSDPIVPTEACPSKTFKVSCCCSGTLFLQHQDLEGLVRASTSPGCHGRVRGGELAVMMKKRTLF